LLNVHDCPAFTPDQRETSGTTASPQLRTYIRWTVAFSAAS